MILVFNKAKYKIKILGPSICINTTRPFNQRLEFFKTIPQINADQCCGSSKIYTSNQFIHSGNARKTVY